MGKVYCSVCRKRCKGDILKIEQQFVHHKCFQCTKCRKNLQKGGFFIRDQQFYCPEDYQAEFGVKCEACQTYVEGEVVTVLGKTFHSQCFRCQICGRIFSSGERTTILGGTYHCLACAAHLSNGLSVTSFDEDEGGALPKFSPTKAHGLRTSPRLSHTMPGSYMGTNSSLLGVSSNGLVGSVPFKNGQLTVQINENGYSNTDSDKRKNELPSTQPGDLCADTLLSTTPGQTFSGESFTYLVGERRIFPPGVDYGRHYPISYLQLAERGLTAIMSSEEVPLQSDHEHELRSKSLLPPRPGAYERQSRRDAARLTASSRFITPVATESGPSATPHQNGSPVPSGFNSHPTTYTSPSSYSMTTSHVPASFSGRPRRDLYVRRRELSPGSASLGSGFQSRLGRSETVGGGPFGTPDKARVSSRSIPNVRSKRGMTMLAESLVQSRLRPNRSVSPEAVTESWIEARRLASYPNARIPDSTSLPAIERFDFPAPPSQAVVMMEKRREKRLAEQRSATGTLTNGTLPADSGDPSVTDELHKHTPNGVPAHVAAKLRQIDAEIETLKRLGESSGITTALIQELEASKLVHIRSPELDPVSASRSPSADTEPGYKTRYDRHVFASPSRDTRRDRRTAHTLSYRMDYSSTGGRSGTIPSSPSIVRPGYTSGVLFGRAVSLPRPAETPMLNGLPLSDISRAATSTPAARVLASGVPRGTATDTKHTAATTRGGHPVNHALLYDGSGDHTLATDESLHTIPGTLDLHGPAAVGSLATSALSMDGLTACSGDDTTAPLAPISSAPYVIKSGTMSGLSHTVTGLRPVGAFLKQQALSGRFRSRTHTPLRHLSDYDSDLTAEDFDTSYPSVQSWLRSTGTRKQTSFKTYPYAQLRTSSGQPPKGIDRTRLEDYLTSADFERVFGMSLPTFKRLPEWKRNDLKRKVDLI